MSTTTDVDADPDADEVETPDFESDDHGQDDGGAEVPAGKRPSKPISLPWRAASFGLGIIVALAVLVGWVGFRDHQMHQSQIERERFMEVAKRGALNLTTIDWRHADADVRRILDGATGEFRDGFAKRSPSFIDEVKQTQATTVGTIARAGLESDTANKAQALVLVSVQTSKAGHSEPAARIWRMRITVEKAGQQIKVSNVEFVS